jgi:hypothetical protein
MEPSSVVPFRGTDGRQRHMNFLELADEGVAIPRGLAKIYPGITKNGDRNGKAKLPLILIQIFLHSSELVGSVLKRIVQNIQHENDVDRRIRSPPFHSFEGYDLLGLMVIKQSKVRFLQAGDRFAGRIGHNNIEYDAACHLACSLPFLRSAVHQNLRRRGGGLCRLTGCLVRRIRLLGRKGKVMSARSMTNQHFIFIEVDPLDLLLAFG